VDAADLLAGYTDEEGDAMSVANLTADNDAEVVDNGDGSFTINPVADFNGTVTLSYDVTDGTDATAATQAVVFAAVNDAPTTTAATAAATEAGAAVEGQLVAEDVDGDELTFSLDAAVVEGLTLNADGSYSFDPSANTAVQALTYTDEPLDVVADYTVDDGNGETVQSTLTVTVDPTPLTFSLVETESFVKEGSTVTYTIEASEAVQSEFTGEVQLTAGDGSQGQTDISDFGAGSFNPQIVTIAEGDTTSTVAEITPLDDGETEYPESYTVEATIDGYTIESIEGEVRDTPDKTFTLTTGVDEFTGGAGNDTFTGVIDGTTGAVATTLTALDSLDGGDGQDVFNLNVLNGSCVVAGTAVTALPTGVTVANIETLKLASAVDLTANTSTWTDVENVNVTQVAGDLDLTVDSASAVDVAGVTGLTEITNGSSVNVSQKIGDGANIANAKDITVDVTNSAAAADANGDGTPGDGVLITGATGVVDVNVTGQKLSGDDGATTTDSVSVTGGTSVNVTQVAASSFGDAATKNAGSNDVVTQGAVDVTATANTSEVTITQDASRGAVDAVEAVTGVASTQEITFSAMTAGQVVSLDFSGGNTLSFTAKKDLTASEVASVFANLENGDVQVDASASLGLYTYVGAGATADSGKWSSGDVIAVDSTKSKVVFSNADNTVTAIKDNTSTGGIDTVAGLTAGTNAKEAVEGVTGIANGQVLVDDHTTTDAIETITLDGYGAASRIGTTNDTTALSTLNLSNSGLTITANTGAVTAAADLTVDDTAATLDLNLEAVGHKSADAALTFTAAPTTLNVTSTGANYVDLTGTGNQIETLAVDGTGVLDLGAASVGTGLKTVTVSGEAGLTLEGSESANITSVNTSATTGKVTSTIDGTNATYTGGAGVDNLTLAAGTALTKAIDLGAGDDTLSFAALAVTGSTATLSGGDGTDTLSMAVGTADSLDGSTQSFYTNFERLVLNDAAVGSTAGTEETVTIDLANLGFTNYVTTNGTAADTTTPANADVLLLKNMASNGTVVLDAAAAGTNTKQTVEIKDAGTATDDVLNVVTDAATGTVLGTLTADNVETLNITANDTDTSVTAGVPNVSTNTLALDADKATNLTLDGDGNLTLTMTAATSEVATIDASLMTGKLNVTTNAGDSGATTVTGGSAADTLTAQGANDVLIGGAGNDSLIVTGGTASAVTLTGGDGIDSFDVSGFTAANGGSAVTITDFEVGETIEFATSATAIFATGKVTLIAEATFSEYVQEAASQAEAAADLLDDATANDSAAHGIAWFEFNDNTFIVQDTDGDGAFTDGADAIVKLNGVVDLSASSFSVTNGTLEYVAA
jgi:S-layer protein